MKPSELPAAELAFKCGSVEQANALDRALRTDENFKAAVVKKLMQMIDDSEGAAGRCRRRWSTSHSSQANCLATGCENEGTVCRRQAQCGTS